MREFQVQVNPELLLAHQVTLTDVLEAAGRPLEFGEPASGKTPISDRSCASRRRCVRPTSWLKRW